ncbi:M48 family metalloprotease [Flavobacteriales bacterium]|nr:M48 family metalloprotease [Flavobacteriales bacterium]
MIQVENSQPIYNDPYENPSPGTRSVTPISMQPVHRHKFNDKELKFDEWRSEGQLKDIKPLDDQCEEYISDKQQLLEVEQRFKQIWDNVLGAARSYCRDRNYRIFDDFEWEYVLLNCENLDQQSCRLHGGHKEHNEEFYGLLNNAASAGNGKLIFGEYFFREMSDDAIAGTIGHEIGHSLAQHSLLDERKKRNNKWTIFWASVAISRHTNSNLLVTHHNTSLFADLVSMKPFSRKQEYEADKIGIVLMTLAGYNPMDEIEELKATPQQRTTYRSTHPGGFERAYESLQFIQSTEFKIQTHKR